MPCAGPSVTSRVVARTSAATMPPGGTMKSAALTAVPVGVVTRIFPDPVLAGTAKAKSVGVTDEAVAGFWLSLAVVAPVAGLKLVPLTVTTVPATPDAGAKPLIVGAPV